MAPAESALIRLYTIGFTGKPAERFFALLLSAGVKVVIDTRLNNRSQLAGFSKISDLPYFLGAIGNIAYRHVAAMAPTQQILDDYKKHKGSWAAYEEAFLNLLRMRGVADGVSLKELADACLLCSEHSPKYCHRRLVAEYLQAHHPSIQIVHLM